MRRHANTEAAKEAGPFQRVPLENRDDRDLMWGDVWVAHTVCAIDGSAGLSGQARERLLERWPQLEPGIECDHTLTGTTLNHLRILRCRHCRQFFIGRHATAFCSEQCKRDRHRESNAKVKRESRRWRRENRDDLPTDCQECGEPITARRLTRRFCSDRCRKRHARRPEPAAAQG